ncbi:Na+/H+ antiporter NhaA [Microbacterium sp. cf332]|uniref:Na+/H+ antiporter NhaA n=1 Tax=Microbacterium sp. cf332 TaxID=1761804 RepID=UPI0008874149|nr:Na+/H+ antiporter NhaA [Microbacterium sp. cf332]SDQ47499.1 sodium/proton antiporter, NhaA family (TC 2.A.33.1.1) [Microbacterium sp. cf332]
MYDALPRRARLRRWLSRETTGGALLLGAAALALIWANSPLADSYRALSQFTIGPAALHLDLSLSAWAADGLLALFFFVVGVELKHEFVAGSLRRPREAAVPVLAAVGGMMLPAILFTAVVLVAGDTGALRGWAIPTATDIAFALAVLAIFGRGLPPGLRTFLLTLAVVDDLLAIVIIAVFYTATIHVLALAVALAAAAVFAVVVRQRWARWWVLLPLGLVVWGFLHASGVHATIAGVLLGFAVPARPLRGESVARTDTYDDLVRPFSSGIALPVFAFFAAGVGVVGTSDPIAVVAQPVVLAIVVGLVVGKAVGVLATTALVTRLTPLRLPDGVGMRDLLPIGLLCGIGFTVSLLITGLSFTDGVHTDGARLGVLLGTLLSATGAAALLARSARRARAAADDGAPADAIDGEGPALGFDRDR